MKYIKLGLTLAVMTASSVLLAQSSSSSSSFLDAEGASDGGRSIVVAPVPASSASYDRPFSKVAFGVGISPLGVQMSMTTNINQHMNIRATGNVFGYSTTFTTEGIGADAKLNLKSAGAALDIYPFHKGFRISPGLLFYNQNQISATGNVPGGTSFDLNDETYYSANPNSTTGATPIHGNAIVSLHTTNPAFTITTGWGNTLPRHGHWSFPFELGVALVGAPKVDVNMGGWACYNQAQTDCADLGNSADPNAAEIRENLNAQIAKWTNDIEPLKTYPIASFGVAYSFGLRNR